ncbi:multicopper oxidase family protein [Mycolicibacterium palauense]|uniref:multicopper oxidase family protein n=1 Tax=Mycolicibacterium palauense TaxID=2034511 RepID=UPI000BFEF250|nr:multicopper oxidase family protein [Mycolicibacterium palauense]
MTIDRRRFLQAAGLGLVGATGIAAGCSRGGTAPAALDLTINAVQSEIDLGGVVVQTWTWGDQVPAQEIRLKKGQTLRARLTNNLPQDTTIHWHGLAIPNDMDGVPVLTQQAVTPGRDFLYEFTVPDAGTYWAHPHVGSQLDRGLYAAIAIEDPDEPVAYDEELVVVLDDWIDGTGTNPDEVYAKLRKTGMAPMGGPLQMTPAMPFGEDGGDVTYPYFIANGRVPADAQVADYRPGDRVRLRVINAGADTIFRVGMPNTTMRVTHTDGFPVVAQQADSVVLGMGERFDAVITIGEDSAPLVAAPYAKKGHAQVNLRVAGKPSRVDVDGFVAALRRQAPLDTAALRPTPAVTLPSAQPDEILDLKLSGPVDGYNWLINGRAYDPTDGGMPVAPGQRVRLRYINESKMVHPMHLHGHTFEVQSPDGPRARKDTVLVAPLQTVVVDIETDNPGQWITHCHNEYHLEAGMATYLRYTG